MIRLGGGAEPLQASVILAATFVGVFVLLVSWVGDLSSISTERSETPEGWETIGLSVDFWDPSTGYLVAPSDPQIHTKEYPLSYTFPPKYDDEDNYYGFDYPYDDVPGIRVWVFRENIKYEEGALDWYKIARDFFLITRHTQDWPFVNVRKLVVPFESVLEQAEDNRSMISGFLGNADVSLFINATGNLALCLYSDSGYTIRIGTAFGENLGKTGLFSTLGRLLTMRLPDCHPVVNAILAIPFWAAIGYIALSLILRIVPWP